MEYVTFSASCLSRAKFSWSTGNAYLSRATLADSPPWLPAVAVVLIAPVMRKEANLS